MRYVKRDYFYGKDDLSSPCKCCSNGDHRFERNVIHSDPEPGETDRLAPVDIHARLDEMVANLPDGASFEITVCPVDEWKSGKWRLTEDDLQLVTD